MPRLVIKDLIKGITSNLYLGCCWCESSGRPTWPTWSKGRIKQTVHKRLTSTKGERGERGFDGNPGLNGLNVSVKLRFRNSGATFSKQISIGQKRRKGIPRHSWKRWSPAIQYCLGKASAFARSKSRISLSTFQRCDFMCCAMYIRWCIRITDICYVLYSHTWC